MYGRFWHHHTTNTHARDYAPLQRHAERRSALAACRCHEHARRA